MFFFRFESFDMRTGAGVDTALVILMLIIAYGVIPRFEQRAFASGLLFPFVSGSFDSCGGRSNGDRREARNDDPVHLYPMYLSGLSRNVG